MTPESPLGYALLGLLRVPQSGYDLRKTFLTTPMGHFSDSPGAIYPALRRLEQRGWIRGGTPPIEGRRRRAYASTAAGRAALREWLLQEPDAEDVVRSWDVVLLRLAFMDGLAEPPAVARWLAKVQTAVDAHLAALEAFRAAPGPHPMPPMAALAFDGGVEQVRARAAWLRRVRQRTRVRSSR